LPAKVQSCLACGKPLVAALDWEGSRVVKASGAGIAVPSGDAAALAGAVETLRGMSPGEREAMGRRGRSYFEAEFDRELLLDRLEGWLEEAASARDAGGKG
jgi:glycosyltransferase involved in cell wall biosynthesis